MKRTLIIISLVFGLGILACLYYPKRAEIAAKVWHWRHGDTAKLGGYAIPIPPDWLVRDQEDHYLVLADTGFATRPRSKPGVSLATVFLNPGRNMDLDRWSSFQKQQHKDDGGPSFEEQRIQFDGETFVCVSTNAFQEALHVPLDGFASLNCTSNGEVDVLFSGYREDVQAFYGVLAQIHKEGRMQ